MTSRASQLVPLLLAFGTVVANSIDAGETAAARAKFVWADFDADDLEDVYVVRPGGHDSLLRNLGDGSFADVTAQALPCVTCASIEVAWRDVDLDRRPDLVRLLVSGEVELLRNRGDGAFDDVSATAGLEGIAGASAVRWLDYDADGRPDLELTTRSGPLLYHGRADFSFEAVALASVDRAGPDESSSVRAVPGALDDDAVGRAGAKPPDGAGDANGSEPAGATPALSGSLVDGLHPDPLAPVTPPVSPLEPPTDAVDFQLPPFANRCAASVRDTSTGDCVLTSTIPALGNLYPMSANLFVSTGGDVGIGTTSPAAKLDVAGTARMTDTLTLAPSGGVALDVSSGSIYKTGALFIHTKGINNLAMGPNALASVTGGFGNTAFGIEALAGNTTGVDNSAFGYQALAQSTSNHFNTAFGSQALTSLTLGWSNTAIGTNALALQTSGSDNIAIGNGAGSSLTGGDNNIFIGNAGATFSSNTIRIGTSSHTRTFIGGIRGVTTTFANAIPVVVDSAGQLGTVSSSRRFKEDIVDMADATERLLDLRPVVFRFKSDVQAGERPLEYGLIAEEVAEILPDLVVYDDEGKPLTVKYHILSSMLLNELKKMRDAHDVEVEFLRAELDALEGRGAPVPTPGALPASKL